MDEYITSQKQGDNPLQATSLKHLWLSSVTAFFMPWRASDDDLGATARELMDNHNLALILTTSFIAAVIMTIITLAAGYAHSFWIALGNLFLLGVLLWLNYAGKTRWAGILTCCFFLITVNALMWVGEGFHDEANLILPAIMIISSLILEKRLFLWFSITAIASLALIGIIETNGAVTNHMSPFTNYTSVAIATTILTGIAIIAIILNKSLALYLSRAKQSENQFRSLFDSSPDGIVMIDFDGLIIDASEKLALMTGYRREDLVRQHYSRFLPTQTHTAVEKTLQDILRGEFQDRTLESNLIRQDGSKLPILLRSWLVTDASERSIAFGAFVQDFTREKAHAKERLLFEKKLQQSQKMEAIGTLAGGIAHDFNNILGAIMGYAQLAQLNTPDNKKAHEYIEQLCLASERAKKLVQQILAFSRQSKTEKIPVDVGLIVKEALNLLRASLPSTIEIRHNVQSNSGTIRADQTQVHQTVMNLCTNAFHAMKETGGQLEVELVPVVLTTDDVYSYEGLKPGRYLKLTVTDTGQGMDKDTVSRIFEPYFTTKEPGEATGMGLATVHGIVKDHGGDIKIYSEPGIGTSFHILFPLIGCHAEKAPGISLSLPRGNEQILFVDDEASLTDVGKRLLESLGYTVRIHNSAYDALEAFCLEPETFDMIITDFTMPKMTGEKLAKEIKKIRPDIPVIICSGFNMRITPENVKEFGIDNVLMKPLALEDIANTVRKVLDETKMSN